MHRPYLYCLCLLLTGLVLSCVQVIGPEDYVAPQRPPTNPGSGGLPPQQQPTPQRRLFISNGQVRLGIDLNAGGAITYLSEANSSVNMVNNVDLGRQIQTSLYAGPIPYVINGKQPVPQWRTLGWNPVQTGDYYNNPARVVSYQQGETNLYVKTVPLIWPLFNEPAECVMEHWIELKDNRVHVRCRFAVSRPDTTQYEARTQESPCVYLNGPYYRMIGYTGLQPFTNAPVTEFTEAGVTNRYSTENWIGLFNEQGRGVGLYRPNEYRYRSSFMGNSRTSGEYDFSSGYVNAEDFLLIDHNGQYEFDYTLILGSITDVRQYVYSQPRPARVPNYRFVNDRQGWYYSNATDTGWPIRNELNVRWSRVDTSKVNFRVSSPLVFWQATEVPKIYIQAAFQTKSTTARFSWRKPDEVDFYAISGRFIDFPIIGDGQYRTYEINLNGVPGWEGVIKQISLDPTPGQEQFEKGSTLRLRSITATPL
ncbi:hypothetical protein DYU11_02855 [Fibrisoma montanum]|uniref:Uncharacterized protein n=1 Tax=Fibrisoma montanum TaxID=2305895 RepID=A0A418MIJ0_9BACT|nr:hypothetical protein [Fibrisoma montanum]RIV27268.1 hypothetical protein DYU11_02855 [Fibrisoma montanum]